MVITEKETKRKQSVDFLMLTLPNGGFTDEQFYEFCQLNDNLKIERNSNGKIIIRPLSGGKTGNINAELTTEFVFWNRNKKRGKIFSSSTGFRLQNGAVYASAVTWLENKSWNELTKEQQEKFVPLCPDFILELLSPSQTMSDLEPKMEEFIENGCRLAWLVDPQNKVTYIYRPKVETEQVPFDQPLFGGQVLEGFQIKMSDIFN